MTTVELRGLTKVFEGGVRAVDGVDLSVGDGEVLAVLGPSGCGKTTLLRLVAGLEEPTSGRIYFDGRDVTDLPTQRRGTALVPQTWALWPHMTVFENVAYGLRLRRMPEREVRRMVGEVLELVGLSGLEDRRPFQLSGGQQQRVALARALVVRPKVLLLDEPLANLDARIRLELREEVRRIAKGLGMTAIYVTHDQEEAMAVADRIAVMNAGRVVQVGTPEEVYRRPASLFVATFMGRANVLRGKVAEAGDGWAVVDVGFKLEAVAPQPLKPGQETAVVVRPEAIQLGGGPLRCRLEDAAFLGRYWQAVLLCGGHRLRADAAVRPGRPGEEVEAHVEYAFAFPAPAVGGP